MDATFLYQDYTIRKLVADDYTAMEQLHEKVYHTTTRKGFYTNKYQHYDELLPPIIGFVAITAIGEIVASVCLVPVKLYQQKQIFIGAQWADAMVHPLHQHKGLGLVLCSSCMQYAKQTGIDFIFCLPIEATFNLVTTKLQHHFVSTMLCYTIATHALPFASVAGRLKLEGWHGSWVDTLFAQYKVPIQSSLQSFSSEYLTIFRDEQFLTYKEKMGNCIIRIGANIIWFTIKKGTLFIGDMIAPTEKDFMHAIAKLKRTCCYAGIRYIVFQTTGASNTAAYYSKHFKATASYKIGAFSFTEVLQVQQLQLTQGDADNF